MELSDRPPQKLPVILLTVFEPFGGSGVNASFEAGRLLATYPGVQMVVLPVTAGDAERVALQALARTQPVLMISLGEAGPEPLVRLEKVAINWDDFRLPDNGGNTNRDVAITADGSDARFATLPVSRIEKNLAGLTPLRVTVSLSAGAFLCNHLAYAVLQAMAGGTAPVCPYLFVHVPCWRPQNGPEALHNLVATLASLLHECTQYAIK